MVQVQVERRRANTSPAGGAGGQRARSLVTDRVNVEPAILHGMNVTEAKIIGLVSVVAFLVAGALLWVLTGMWQLLLMLAIFGPAMTLWFASAYLAGIKRGRPDGYYSQAIQLWLVDHGLAKSAFIRHHGYWNLGREFGIDISSRLDISTGPDEFASKHKA